MTEQELIEALAAKEHESWARWQSYLYTKCYETYDGNYVIPVELVDRWRKQINIPYAELSEQEKQSDRNEVAHILPIIHGYCEEDDDNNFYEYSDGYPDTEEDRPEEDHGGC